MSKSRYVGGYPVIGIRPVVDGRRGPMQLRESLEGQVMAMANAAKKLFEENLFYSNGGLKMRLMPTDFRQSICTEQGIYGKTVFILMTERHIIRE